MIDITPQQPAPLATRLAQFLVGAFAVMVLIVIIPIVAVAAGLALTMLLIAGAALMLAVIARLIWSQHRRRVVTGR